MNIRLVCLYVLQITLQINSYVSTESSVDMSWKTETIHDMLSNLFTRTRVHSFEREISENARMFDKIIGYEGIKRTFVRSLNSKEPVHILLVGPAGHAKTLFLKCILETFGEKKASQWVVMLASRV